MQNGNDNCPVVLVADDDAATRYLMTTTLAGGGYSVIEATDGEQAIRATAEERPDIVLMDVEMPVLDGYGACSAIRRSDDGRDLPIVMVTGHDDPASVDRAYEMGATDFIAKPINWHLIGHRLRYILRGARNLRALAVSESEKRALLAAIPDSIFVLGYDGIVAADLSGANLPMATRGPVVGRDVRTLLPPNLAAAVDPCIETVVDTGQCRSVECQVHDAQTGKTWYESRYVPHGEDRLLLIVRDISERKAAEQRIHFLAYFDALTGLPNRASFMERLESTLEEADATRGRPAVLCTNLDRFKRINDSLGAATGDSVLMEVANRVSTCLEALFDARDDAHAASWHLARLGGDEFAVLLPDLEHGPDVVSVGQQIKSAIAAPMALGGHEFVMTASIGASAYPRHGRDAEALIKHATLARDEARKAGDGTCRFYRKSMNANAIEYLDLENDLRRALEDDELQIHYQPKYRTDSMRVCGAEALLRWVHPERGDIPPSTFIPIAEESGLIADIGRWVADGVCQQIAAWQYFGCSPGPIAFNVSGHEFGSGDVVETIASAVRRAGIGTSDVQLEITESVLIGDIRSVKQALHMLREHGFSLAVDDFGTGYSSLCYLQDFPVDALKIDRSFVRDVERNTDSRTICSGIIALAKSLGLAVVGEGVENDWQVEFLRRQKCDYVQGFLLGEAMPADRYAALLADERPEVGRDRVVVPLARH